MDEDVSRRLRGIDRTLRGIAICAAAVLLAWALRDILLLAFAAILGGCVLRGASDALGRRTGLSPGWSLLVLITALIVVFGGAVWWHGPAVADELAQLTDQLVSQGEKVWQQLRENGWAARLTSGLRSSTGADGTGIAHYLTGIAGSTFGIGGSLVVVIATAIFLAISPDSYVEGVMHLLPPDWRPRGREVMRALGRTLQLWFLGQLIDMAFVMVLTGAGLLLLGTPLAVALAVVAGLCNFVPYIGALAGAIPAILVALAQSPTLALWVALVFVVVQTVEGNVTAPLIQKRTVSLPPALTILSQTVLGTLFGVLGLVLATPVTAAAMAAIRMIYVESILEGRPHDSSA